MTEEKPPGAARAPRRPDPEAQEPAADAETNTNGGPPSNEPAAAKSPSRRKARPQDGGRVSATTAARQAALAVAELTGHDVETIISLEPCDDGWIVGVEIVETRRIPDSADILANYETRLDHDGALLSYRRIQRYARGQLYGARR